MVGCGGAGKSTLARELGVRLGLDVIHLDRWYWGPGWTRTPDGDWTALHAQLIARPAWIVDGNYSPTIAPRVAAADAVVFLDFATWRCVGRLLRRRARHLRGARPDAHPGCRERLTPRFLWWVATFRRRTRPRVLDALAGHPHVVALRRPADVRRLLRDLPAAIADGRAPAASAAR